MTSEIRIFFVSRIQHLSLYNINSSDMEKYDIQEKSEYDARMTRTGISDAQGS
jgi:hypothetical protein